ncbi:Sua5/YciO/YrdC/YwlC family tRNA threonylcarbamoyl adenosine modification protein [Elsinoe australis]|uniref:Threonylcarbamoyl-AMP synthase n=1 Tax=Elsinoe australis TaxID=40998 RepID=A0A2P8A8X4_9PEZI|nr:Sua5/YciO/YrdC/YwlC family tRNA threonylcarbamoyl adenosine modification protein [Elsinoe australis]
MADVAMEDAPMIAANGAADGDFAAIETEVVPISPSQLGHFEETLRTDSSLPLEDWTLELSPDNLDAQNLHTAARLLRESTIPVAFPTETVYGLGADATRSEAVLGIYKAKQRPSDNPLIVHIASLQQLRCLLLGSRSATAPSLYEPLTDPIPEIYQPLIKRFWPGPLTIILHAPENSPLAPETTAGLQTFGARMPRNLLALALIKLADRPIAAPSANASTKPSPTAAEHVLHDLGGRIELILDGGPCPVGVESTVVDGLSVPPVILRPGGVSIGDIRSVRGWEKVEVAYEDKALQDGNAEGPRAPGMKYRHYSPKARVVLFDHGKEYSVEDLKQAAGERKRVGMVRTKRWRRVDDVGPKDGEEGFEAPLSGKDMSMAAQYQQAYMENTKAGFAEMAKTGAGQLNGSPLEKMLAEQSDYQAKTINEIEVKVEGESISILDIGIGPGTSDIARGLFSALRDLDRKDLDTIIVEGIDGNDGDDISAAVMNRLRKAAEVNVS